MIPCFYEYGCDEIRAEYGRGDAGGIMAVEPGKSADLIFFAINKPGGTLYGGKPEWFGLCTGYICGY
jgi:hypothetical protein